MNVITLKPHRYKNKQKVKGDKYEFKGTKQELRLALALWVKPDVDLVPKPAPWPAPPVNDVIENVIDPVIVADEVGTTEEVEHVEVTIPADDSNVVVDVTYKPRRTYKRRDMVSEE